MSFLDYELFLNFKITKLIRRSVSYKSEPLKRKFWMEKGTRIARKISGQNKTYRLLQFERQPGMISVHLPQKSLLASKFDILSTWAVHQSQTPQPLDCQSWSWWHLDRSGCLGHSRSCSRRCCHYVWPLEGVSRLPGWRLKTLRRPWPGRVGRRVLRGGAIYFVFVQNKRCRMFDGAVV